MSKIYRVLVPQTSEEYQSLLPIYRSLEGEVKYILSDALKEAGIKIHTVESRVKKFHSIQAKRKNVSNNPEINDVVGARVVCLFRSDLKVIDDIITNEFDVISKDDKINKSNDSFGYMSIHYIACLADAVSGRRYDAIKRTIFEIQVRTLCMHAWAAISHYLDYKTEQDIPEHLRKDLNALSGLFYVADSQYEQLYDARQDALNSAVAELNSGISKGTSINLDSMTALLKQLFPNRRLDSSDVSELVSELIEAGFKSTEEVSREVTNRLAELEKSERSYIGSGGIYYTASGAARVSLCDSHQGYKSVYDKKNSLKETKASRTRKKSKSPPQT